MGSPVGTTGMCGRLWMLLAVALAMAFAGCGSGPAVPEGTATVSEALAATVTTIAVTPVTASIPATVQQQFKATATYSNGKTKSLSTEVAWSVSDPTLASIDATGLATGLAAGTVTVTATFANGVAGTASLVVTSATLSSITLTPKNKQLAVGGVVAFNATGTFSDGTTFPLSGPLAWTSSTPSIATVDATTGVATGVAAGTVSVLAQDATTGLVGKAFLTVGTATLKSLAVTPNTTSFPVNGFLFFGATGFYSDGTTADLTAAATWTVSRSDLAFAYSDNVDAGAVVGLAPGAVTVTATVGGKKANAALTVTAPTCSDTVQNGTETAVDCGGSCGPCANGLTCQSAADCQSGTCAFNVCRSVEAISFDMGIPVLTTAYAVGTGGTGVLPVAGANVISPTGTPASGTDACDPLPDGSLTGNAALIRRGGCLFYTKAINAEAAGAVAVILYDNLTEGLVTPLLTPNPAGSPPVAIPVISIDRADGEQISNAIESSAATATINWLPVPGN
jgi:uncharacterized protein YjdB